MTPTIPGLCERCQVNAIQNGSPWCEECRSDEAFEQHADAADQPEIEIDLDAPEFDDRCLYGLLGDYVSAVASETEAHPAAIYASALGHYGVSIGWGRVIGGDPVTPLRINPLLVGPSGWGRKGTASQVVDSAWETVHTDLKTIHGLSSGQGLVELIRDVSADGKIPGVVDKRMYLIEEEITKLRSLGNQNTSTLKDTLKFLFDHRTVFDNPRVAHVRVTHPHVACELHAQPSTWAAMPEEDIRSGFLNRFLHIWCYGVSEMPDKGDWRNENVRRISHALHANLEANYKRGEYVELTKTDAAQIAWREFYHETRIMLKNNQDDRLGDLLARGPDQIARIAGISTVAQGVWVIDEQAMEAAQRLWAYSVETVRYLESRRLPESAQQGLALAQRDRSLRHAAGILSALTLAAKDGILMSKIQEEVFNGNVPAPQIKMTLQGLEAQGLVVIRVFKPTIGRPGKKVYLRGFEPKGE